MYEIIVKKEFKASHNIIYSNGKVDKKHSHIWRVEVYVERKNLSKDSLVLDFKILQKELIDLLTPLFDKYINEIPPFNKVNPSAENLAKWVYDNLKGRIKKPNRLKKIIVYEGENFAASYIEGFAD